jgi:hypothetical protein
MVVSHTCDRKESCPEGAQMGHGALEYSNYEAAIAAIA